MTMDVQSPCSVSAAFRRLRAEHPDLPVFTFLDHEGRDQSTLTFAQLGDEAERVAAELHARGLGPGDRALLVYLETADFVVALLGCLALGVIPVPVCPPNPFTLHHDLDAFTLLAESTGARVALTNATFDRARASMQDGHPWPLVHWLRTDRPTRPRRTTWYEPAELDEPALLHYTSGSTGSPRGVVLSHRNLHHELAHNAVDLGLGLDTRAVSWLPHFHDLGLICFLLSAMSGNGRVYQLSPLTFLHRPTTWFDVLARVRATHTAAPNFAYDLAVRKTTEQMRANWDLSALRVVMTAAEQVRPATVDAFLAAFAVSGLDRNAFYPAYGLAEHTVSVTMGGRGRLRVEKAALDEGKVVQLEDDSDVRAVTYVACGRVTKQGADVRIVDPRTRQPCGTGQVGEIWVDSPSKALGYFGLPEETAECFEAVVAGEFGGRRYLRTGDLGFLHEEELYLTGRYKDLIIVHGQNHYPQDIEDSVRGCHAAVRAGGVAAFAVTTGDNEPAAERLVLYVELKGRRPGEALVDEVVRAVRHAVYTDHRLASHTVVVGLSGLVSKTTSGKIRRQACKEAFLSGSVHEAPYTVSVSALH
ncbi:fatty acyl-AMP ligase [Kutzneria albida]|uniref:Uncharacterized protein n=1 Tax=Kutzneria albida DSM 43870 TaxID=1449976 RepID=W5WK54_9PSEU|nr:fatty acyl-AMP ligase [Kutzneria albida]AHI01116.1 hypothetical protein KALB_7758 [Kutzneria albida DSM 43870]